MKGPALFPLLHPKALVCEATTDLQGVARGCHLVLHGLEALYARNPAKDASLVSHANSVRKLFKPRHSFGGPFRNRRCDGEPSFKGKIPLGTTHLIPLALNVDGGRDRRPEPSVSRAMRCRQGP